MARETWTINGWDVTDGFTRDVEFRTGLYAVPAMVGENQQVPGRRGTLWSPKVYGPGQFTLACWFGGADRTAFEAQWDAFIKVFAHPEGLLTIRRGLASGEVRECRGEVTGVVSPTPVGQLAARAALQVGVPDGVWRSVGSYTDGAATVATDGMQLSLTSFAVCTAPMDELTYTVVGPASNPRVSVPGTDEWMQYTGTVNTGQTLVVNCGTWAITGTGGLNPPLAALTFGGASRYLTVPVPLPGITPKVVFEGDNLDTTTRLTVSGRRVFLV